LDKVSFTSAESSISQPLAISPAWAALDAFRQTLVSRAPHFAPCAPARFRTVSAAPSVPVARIACRWLSLSKQPRRRGRISADRYGPSLSISSIATRGATPDLLSIAPKVCHGLWNQRGPSRCFYRHACRLKGSTLLSLRRRDSATAASPIACICRRRQNAERKDANDVQLERISHEMPLLSRIGIQTGKGMPPLRSPSARPNSREQDVLQCQSGRRDRCPLYARRLCSPILASSDARCIGYIWFGGTRARIADCNRFVVSEVGVSPSHARVSSLAVFVL
jgi:hypothetical protein